MLVDCKNIGSLLVTNREGTQPYPSAENWIKDLLSLTLSTDYTTLMVAQMVKHMPTMPETWVQSLGREDLLEKEMATQSSILAWRNLWTEEPGRLQSMGSQRVRHD